MCSRRLVVRGAVQPSSLSAGISRAGTAAVDRGPLPCPLFFLLFWVGAAWFAPPFSFLFPQESPLNPDFSSKDSLFGRSTKPKKNLILVVRICFFEFRSSNKHSIDSSLDSSVWCLIWRRESAGFCDLVCVYCFFLFLHLSWNSRYSWVNLGFVCSSSNLCCCSVLCDPLLVYS